jgi:hypothetical protein
MRHEIPTKAFPLYYLDEDGHALIIILRPHGGRAALGLKMLE